MFNTRKIANKKKQRRKRIKLIVYSFLLIVFLTSFYFLLFGSYFKINNISIAGNKKVKTGDILIFIDDYFKNNKKSNIYWILDASDLSEKLHVFFSLKGIDIDKELPNKLTIKIVEREPGFILKIGNKKGYLLDKQGVLIRPILDEKNEAFDLPIIVDNISDINIHGRGLSTIDIIFLYKIGNFLSNNNLEDRFFEKEDNSGISVVLVDGKKILFSLNENIDGQIIKLKSLVFDTLKVEECSEYIDLRFANKVYYK